VPKGVEVRVLLWAPNMPDEFDEFLEKLGTDPQPQAVLGKLRVKWTVETAQDLRLIHGIEESEQNAQVDQR
jgi:hypothetical protein